MLFRYTQYMNRCFCWKSLDLAMGETIQQKIKTNSQESRKIKILSIIDIPQKLLWDWAARVPATCNQMNEMYKQLRSKKVPSKSWDLVNGQTSQGKKRTNSKSKHWYSAAAASPADATEHFRPAGKSFSRLAHARLFFSRSLARRKLVSNISQGPLDRSVE